MSTVFEYSVLITGVLITDIYCTSRSPGNSYNLSKRSTRDWGYTNRSCKNIANHICVISLFSQTN